MESNHKNLVVKFDSGEVHVDRIPDTGLRLLLKEVEKMNGAKVQLNDTMVREVQHAQMWYTNHTGVAHRYRQALIEAGAAIVSQLDWLDKKYDFE